MSVRVGLGEGVTRRRAELEEYLRDRPRRLTEHLKGEEAKRRESIERAIAALKKERWRLYMRLLTPYLCDDSRPELVDVWREQAESSVSRKFALEDHEEALEYLLSRLE